MVTRIIPLLVLDLNELHRSQQENVVQFNAKVESLHVLLRCVICPHVLFLNWYLRLCGKSYYLFL